MPAKGERRRDVIAALAAWSVVVPCVPIAVMVVRLLAGDWQPLGDAAYFAVRSRDVLTEEHPLLGAWSSGSAQLEESVNNLGPLQLDLLAPFTRTLGPEGLALGVGLINVACVVGVWAVTRRLLGPLGVLAAMAATVMLEWSIGSRQLVEGRQQWALILPLWCLLFLVWALAAGRAWAAPPLVFVASLVAQTHLTFAVVAAGMCVVAVVGFGVGRWRDRGAEDDGDDDAEGGADRALLRPALVSAAVALACWAQPLWDQFFDSGNLGRVLTSGDTPGLGGESGAAILAGVAATPPFWLADSLERFDPVAHLSLDGAALVRLGLLVLFVVGATVVVSRSATDRAYRTVTLLGLPLLVVGWWASATIPATAFGPADQNYRWLWPVAAFVTFGLAVAAAGAVRSLAPQARPALGAALAAVVVLGALPSTLSTVRREFDIRHEDAVVDVAGELRGELARSLDAHGVEGPVLFDRSLENTFSPFSYSLMSELQAAGIEFRFDAGEDRERFGERAVDVAEAASLRRLYVVTGSNLDRVGVDLLTDVEVVELASASAVSSDEESRRRALDHSFVAALRDGRIAVDVARARALLGDRADPLVRLLDGGAPDDLAYLARLVEGLHGRRLLSGDAARLAEVEEWAVLHRSDQLERVGVFIERS